MSSPSLRAEDAPPVLVLGFDALDFGQLDAFAGSLPTFSRLREEGVSAPLRSTFPPITGSAWPSMYTGVGPGYHGAFGFFTYDGYPDEATVVTRNDVHAPAIWNYLTAQDVPSIVLNVPVTHPAGEITGVVVPGDTAPRDAPGTPDGIRAELSDEVGEYRIYPDEDRPIPERFVELVDIRERAARHLLTERPWRLAIVQVQVTDTVFHKTSDRSAHRRVYERADRLVDGLLSVVDDEVSLVVCSDHGMGRNSGHRIYINEMLERRGYLRRAADSSPPSMRTEERVLAGTDQEKRSGSGEGGLHTALASRLVQVARRMGIEPATAYLVAQKVGVEGPLKRLVPEDARTDATWGVDWGGSRAYCGTSSEYGIRINLEGREPAGVVEEADYEALRTEFVDLLSALETPSGVPAFEFVKRREAVYDGPRVERAPDLLFYPTDENHDVSTDIVGREFLPVDAFNHRRDGVFIGHGPLFDTSWETDVLSLTDVAPMVMALLGCSVPDRMTGSVPDDLLACFIARERYEDVTYGAQKAGSESREVRDRLEGLGYL